MYSTASIIFRKRTTEEKRKEKNRKEKKRKKKRLDLLMNWGGGTAFCKRHCICSSTIPRKTIVLLFLCVTSAYVMLYCVQQHLGGFVLFVSKTTFPFSSRNKKLKKSSPSPSGSGSGPLWSPHTFESERERERKREGGKKSLHPHPPPMREFCDIRVF